MMFLGGGGGGGGKGRGGQCTTSGLLPLPVA